MINVPEFQVPYRLAADVKTMWDEFAMSAMNGLLANSKLRKLSSGEVSEFAGLVADAMLAERAKR